MDRCRWVGERNEVVRLGRVGLHDMDKQNYFYHIDYKVINAKYTCACDSSHGIFFQFCD
jgi:hypothetical protein